MSEQPRGFYYADVVAVQRLTVHMIRVTFGGEDVSSYETLGVPDECVGVYFPRAGEASPPPMTEVDGVWWFHGVEDAPEGRNYTIRRLDPVRGQLTIDFFAHEGGVASTWAQQAAPGQRVLFTRPRSWYSPPADVDWLLLVADMTGLPALGRLVEQLPAGTRAHAIVEVLERGDIQSFSTRADVTYDWRIGSGNGDSASVLDDAALAHPLPAGRGYVWFAGEASSSRRVRKYFRKQLGYDIAYFDIIGYWRADSEKWLEKYKQYQEEALAVYNGVIESGRSEQEASEAFDALLERVGL